MRIKINTDFIKMMRDRYDRSVRYHLPKWVEFCESMIAEGFEVYLHEAKTTVSKYIYVYFKNKKLKVRYSNHRPNKRSEQRDDSDLFVGVSNFNVVTTEEAILLSKQYLTDMITKNEFERYKDIKRQRCAVQKVMRQQGRN